MSRRKQSQWLNADEYAEAQQKGQMFALVLIVAILVGATLWDWLAQWWAS